MVIENSVLMGEEEIEEALLEYINKHKGTDFKSITDLYLVNGTQEYRVIATGFKFKVKD